MTARVSGRGRAAQGACASSAAALLALAASASVAPAHAQTHCDSSDPTEIWCATLTVKDHTSGVFRGFGTGRESFGSLTDTSFVYRGVQYTVAELFLNHGVTLPPLSIKLSPTGESVFKSVSYALVVGGADLSFEDATYSGEIGFRWQNPGLSWSVDDTVEVKLLERPNTPAGNTRLTVAYAIPNQSAQVGVPFSYTFHEDTFAHADKGETLTYRARGRVFEEGGYEVLPGTSGKKRPWGWLKFDASTRTISGTPPPGSDGTWGVDIIAVDEENRDVSASFRIVVAVEPGLVGNLRQPVTAHRRLDGCDHAQKFTTGSHSNGYAVTSVDVWLSGVHTSANFPAVAIRNVESGGGHGSVVGTLVAPGSGATGSGKLYRYTASAPLVLTASTTYVLTFEGSSASVWRTGWTSRDPGSAAGWSIATTTQRRCHSASYEDARNTSTTTLRINGTTGAMAQVQADPPTVVGIPSLHGAGEDAKWSPGDIVGVTVEFSEPVTVDTSQGVPSVTVELGARPADSRSAPFASGSGTSELTFQYEMTDADGAQQFMALTTNSLALNGGTIQSVATGADADLAHNGTAAQGSTARGTGPEATFSNAPDNHDGQNRFSIEVQFSGAPAGFVPKRNGASAFEIEGGTITGVAATSNEANPPWRVTIEPDGNGDVTVRIPVRECAQTNAVCIAGKPLVRAAQATVPGPDTGTVACAAPALSGGATLVWTGELGVEAWTDRDYYGFGSGRGTLDDTDFSLGANRYVIDHVTQREGTAWPMVFSLTSSLGADEKRTLTLHVCDGTEFHFDDASELTRWHAYRWSDAGGVDWSGHTERTLYLSRDTTAPTLDAATVDGASLALTFSEDLAAASGLTASAFSVTANASPVTVDSVAIDARTVTLALVSPVSAGAAVTVSYARPSDTDNRLRDRFDNPVADIAATEVTNSTAAGLPVVSIVATATPVTEGTSASFTLTRTGRTAAALEVSVSVSEAGNVLDGTTPSSVSFAAGSPQAQLAVATENDATHEADARVTASVVAGDGYTVDGAGASAAVDVFDNDTAPAQETAQTLWSTTMLWQDFGEGWYGGYADTFGGTVAAFDDPEWTEDGTTFRIWYISYHAPSRELEFMHNGQGGYIADPDTLSFQIGKYTVEPGTAMTAFAEVRAATVSGIDSQWTVGEDIAIRLTRRTGETTVETPAGPAVSVDDAQVNESAGIPLRFVVRLAERSDTTVSVRYQTSDDTARAGLDYTAARGVVRFDPGQQSKTVEVKVLEDQHNEGSETMRLTLSRPFGATLTDATATGTIVNTDPMPKAWLARFGRTVAEQAIDAVQARFDTWREPGLAGTFAGAPLGGGAEPGVRAHPDEDAERGLGTLAGWLRGEEDEEDDETLGFGEHTLSPSELLAGSSFSLTRGTAESGFASFWGRGAVTTFDGRDGDMTLDGEVASAMVGADFSRDALLAGLMLSHSRGEGGYHGGSGAGTVESTLTALFPYARYALSERLSVWGMTGYGEGTLTLTPEGQAPLRPDMDFLMGAVGVRSVLVDGGAEGATLTAKSDAFAVRTGTDAVSGDAGRLEATEADVTRVRLALEGSRPFALSESTVLTPSVELGVRHDGGDAETGFGADIGAGLALYDPTRGLSAEIRARGLLSHEDDGVSEQGLSGTLAFDPTPESERGLSLSLTQTVGAGTWGGTEALLERTTLAGLGAVEDESLGGGRLDARVGYGFSVFDERYTATPELGLGLSDSDREFRLGWRLSERVSAGLAFELGLQGTRREYTAFDAQTEGGVEHGIVVGAGWRLVSQRMESLELRIEAARHEAESLDTGPEDSVGIRVGAAW